MSSLDITAARNVLDAIDIDLDRLKTGPEGALGGSTNAFYFGKLFANQVMLARVLRDVVDLLAESKTTTE